MTSTGGSWFAAGGAGVGGAPAFGAGVVPGVAALGAVVLGVVVLGVAAFGVVVLGAGVAAPPAAGGVSCVCGAVCWALTGRMSKAVTPAARTSRHSPLPAMSPPSARLLSAFTPAKLNSPAVGHWRYRFSGIFPEFRVHFAATQFLARKELGSGQLPASSAAHGCNCVSFCIRGTPATTHRSYGQLPQIINNDEALLTG